MIKEEKILTAKLKYLDHKITLVNKNDPDYKIMPIIARDLKHSKGHFAFSSIERNIRGKGPGDNWTIREYKQYQYKLKKERKLIDGLLAMTVVVVAVIIMMNYYIKMIVFV